MKRQRLFYCRTRIDHQSDCLNSHLKRKLDSSAIVPLLFGDDDSLKDSWYFGFSSFFLFVRTSQLLFVRPKRETVMRNTRSFFFESSENKGRGLAKQNFDTH